MSYYKKALFVAALCASIGLNSANAVKFESLNNVQKGNVLNICELQEAFTKDLQTIIDALRKVAKQLKNSENVDGASETLVFISESMPLFNRDANRFTNQIAFLLLRNKNTSKEQKETGSQLAEIIKQIVEKLNKSLNPNELTDVLSNDFWKKFEKLAQEINDIANKAKQGIIGFKGTQDEWADVLFGKKKKIHQKIKNSSQTSEQFIKLKNDDQFENNDNLSIKIKENFENEINFDSKTTTNDEDITLQLGILNSLSSKEKNHKGEKTLEDEDDNEIKEVFEISLDEQKMKEIQDSELQEAIKRSLEK
jgi:hypothetical protein